MESRLQLDVLHPRRPVINYESPAICEAIFSSSSFPTLVLEPIAAAEAIAGLEWVFVDGKWVLNWNNYPGALCYSVYYQLQAGDPFPEYQLIAECITDPQFDPDLPDVPDIPTPICYIISVITPNGEVALSDPICTSVLPDDPPDGTPGNCVNNLTAVGGTDDVVLNWDDVTIAESYQVWRSTTAGGPYTQIAVALVSSHTDTEVTHGETYYYVIRPMFGGNSLCTSTEVSAVVGGCPVLSLVADSNSLNLSWDERADATTYSVRRSESMGGPYAEITSTANTFFDDDTVSLDVTYYYVVVPINAALAPAEQELCTTNEVSGEVASTAESCNGEASTPEAAAWTLDFVSADSSIDWNGSAGTASLNCVSESQGAQLHCSVCRASTPTTYTLTMDYTIGGSQPPFVFPPDFIPVVVLRTKIDGGPYIEDTSPQVGLGSSGTLTVDVVIPGDGATHTIYLNIEYIAIPAGWGNTQADCVITGASA